MRFQIILDIEVERESGKFASRDEIEESLVASIQDADPGSIDGIGADGDSIYNIMGWDASPGQVQSRRRKK